MPKFVERILLDEYMALPEEKPYLELLDGLVVEKCMGCYRQQTLVTDLLVALAGFAHDRGLPTPLPYVSCSDSTRKWVFVPAISWFSRERAPWSSRETPHPLPVLPELMVESMREGEHAGWMLRRIAHCLANGVELFWAIDADTRTVTEWRPGSPSRDYAASGRIGAAPALPEFELDLARLFGALDD